MGRRFTSPVSADQSNWLIATKQIWKLYVALLGFTAAFLCFVVAGFAFMTEGQLLGIVVGIGMVLGVGTFIWLLRGLRCPSCRNPLAWTMIRKQSHLSWLIDLVNLTDCPICKADLMKAVSRNREIVSRST